MKRVLVYAFLPWGGRAKNVSAQVLELLTVPVEKKYLRVKFAKQVFREIAEGDWEIIIGLGQYPRGKRVRIEQITRNEYGEKGSYKVIEHESKDKEVDLRLKPVVRSYVSCDAGRYVCNYSMYQSMKWKKQETKFAFLHIPKRGEMREMVRVVTQLLGQIGVE